MSVNERKVAFLEALKKFASGLSANVSSGQEWTVKGFIDIKKKIYTISSDTKIVSKILEIHLFPLLNIFAEQNGYDLELASCQNYYPDLTFILKEDKNIKFAVDLKTTYRDEKNDEFCNGFTLGSHGEYFKDRTSSKNIQYPYEQYLGHFCLGVIYSRGDISRDEELKVYEFTELEKIRSVIKNFIFFAEEKWKIASDKGGSGNTANIGSIRCIEDLINGNGVFASAGEDIFDNYWQNFNVLQITLPGGSSKKLTSLKEYLEYRGLPETLYNAPRSKYNAPRSKRRQRRERDGQ